MTCEPFKSKHASVYPITIAKRVRRIIRYIVLYQFKRRIALINQTI